MQQSRLVPILTGHSWKDLVISQDTHSGLDEISKWISARESKPSGRDTAVKGLNVLFDGPRNTLKDIAAILIAKEANWPVYRVDLSGVLSEYIGETEKNLSHVFDQADNKNSILFFDEADALFGKRTDIKDAHDKYATMFLDLLDQFNGLAIVSANLRNNIDEAFLRRFQMVISIGTPDKKETVEKKKER
jgi:SpoVK/Ycf46/Vps4 family AAA+-type ATPase